MNRYAIIMGCDEYKEYNNIPYCNDDVYIMQEALNEYCDYNLNNIEIINLMEKDEDSKIEGLLRKISEFIKKINPEDMLLFYFAGHGIVIENKGYLVLPETEIGKEKTTALSIEALNNLFNEKNINHFNIIDACHSGCDNGQVRGLDFLNIIENQSWATLASCSVNEESYWDNKLEHGVFTYYVVESIEESSTESDITIENLKQMVC